VVRAPLPGGVWKIRTTRADAGGIRSSMIIVDMSVQAKVVELSAQYGYCLDTLKMQADMTRAQAICHLQTRSREARDHLRWKAEHRRDLTGWEAFYEDWYWERTEQEIEQTLQENQERQVLIEQLRELR